MAEYEAEQKREPEQSALRQQIALAENELPRYDELDQVRKELDARRDALKAALDQREEQKNLQDKCALLLNDAKEKLEAVKDAGREEAVFGRQAAAGRKPAERRRSLGRRIERVGKPFEAIGRGAAEVSGRCSKGGETAAEVSADEQGIPSMNKPGFWRWLWMQACRARYAVRRNTRHLRPRRLMHLLNPIWKRQRRRVKRHRLMPLLVVQRPVPLGARSLRKKRNSRRKARSSLTRWSLQNSV